MATIVTRAGKGSPLTNNEVDANFTNLNSDKLESGDTVASLTITSADINGGTIDGVTLGTNSAVTEAQIDNLNINGNTITSTDTDGNIALTPNGTGEVDISKVDIDGGTIDGTVIGGSTPAAISGTTGTFSGNLTVDTNTLFVDAANNRVGIGTSSPQKSLVVSDGGGIGIELSPDDAGQGYSRILNYDRNASAYEPLYVEAEDLRFSTGASATERMRIDSSGNVLCGSDGGGDIGSSTKRFKDLYLSGGVYLGGTGAANYLDDYEEGTWTPTVEGTIVTGTGTYSGQSGKYTKVGNLVTVFGHYVLTAHTGLGKLQISGLPFTAANESNLYTIGQWSANDLTYDASAVQAYVFSVLNTTELVVSQLVSGSGNQAVDLDPTHAAWFSISYYV